MRTLVTGNMGYFGRALENVLQDAGHSVKGWDCGLFSGWDDDVRDIRDISAADLSHFDNIVHLAALSNDATGELAPQMTREINLAAAVRIAELAREAGVRRFVFASSCSVYGAGSGVVNDENSTLNPLTEYARSKASAEVAMARLSTDGFWPVSLRFATLYGDSPSFRSDLVVNRMVCTAWRYGSIFVVGDGSISRPLLHVRDASNAIEAVLQADRATVTGEVFNVGASNANYRIFELAELVGSLFDEVRLEHGGTADTRDYAVDFRKFQDRFKGWNPGMSPLDGAREVLAALDSGRLADLRVQGADWGPTDRGQWLRSLRREAKVSGDLRWADSRLLPTSDLLPHGDRAVPVRPV
ncbi:SDR family oxidoreductase [Dactylosporangium sp. NPDC051485]|uniref:NAD-dependent epimerase/dehydratase family protein n=1 Tax=Dactylosporangium sp. NPDC051485 TaxID=3154846 RepID=UPI0034390629